MGTENYCGIVLCSSIHQLVQRISYRTSIQSARSTAMAMVMAASPNDDGGKVTRIINYDQKYGGYSSPEV